MNAARRAMHSKWGPVVATAGLILARPSAVSATEGAETASNVSFRLSWVRADGADSCVDEPELRRQIQARLGRDPFVADGEHSIEGGVARAGERFHAELRIRDRGGVLLGARTLETQASECGELTEALVLAIALTVDPDAALASRRPRADDRAPRPKTTESLAGLPPKPAALGELQCPRRPEIGDARPRRASSELRETNLQVSLRALAAAGVLPGVAPGAAVSGSLGLNQVDFTVSMSWLPERRTSEGTLSLGLSYAAVGTCLHAAQTRRGLVALGVCAEAEFGAIHAVVHRLRPLQPGDYLWMALAAGPRLQLQGLRPAVIELGILTVVPLWRPRFSLLGIQEPLFESSGVGVLGFVGVGMGGR